VFPADDEEWADLDSYYMKHKTAILGLMLVSFAVFAALQISMGRQSSPLGNLQGGIYLALLSFTVGVPWKWANAAGLVGLIALDVWVFAK
jgi:hypothetical protein